MPRIYDVRRSLSDFDLDELREIHKHIIKATVKNKIFTNGKMDNLKVVDIDGVELFESTKKFCDKCLGRVHKNRVTHYFYRSVVCATVSSNPHIIVKKYLNLIEIVHKRIKRYVKIKAWYEDNFEMVDSTIKVRLQNLMQLYFFRCMRSFRKNECFK